MKKIIDWLLLGAVFANCAIIVFIIVASISALACAGESYEAQNLDDVHAASCRVVCSNLGGRSGSIGTGTVVLVANGKYWILTNWHVVTGFKTFRLDFFRDGKIKSVTATLEKSWHNNKAPYDFAVLTVPEDKLIDYNPPVVPLAGSDVRPLLDRPIYSSGCSEGRWSLAWKGFIEDYYGNTAQFYPAPKSGQSGSAIVQRLEEGLRVTGVLTWRVGDEKATGEEQMRGGAIPISHFYAAASGKNSAGHKESVPPGATWCTVTEDKKKNEDIRPESKTQLQKPRVWPVLTADAYFDKPACDYSDLILFMFTRPDCAPCEVAKISVKKLIKEGYPIEIIDSSTESGKKNVTNCNITSFPSFLLCRDNGKEYTGLEQWSGSLDVEQRIRSVFTKHGKRPTSDNKEELTGTAAAAARRRERRELNPQQTITPPSARSPDVGSENESGSGSGDVSPLINGSAPAPKQDSAPHKVGLIPRREEPKPNDIPAGLIDKITTPLTSKLDKLVEGLEKKANEQLDGLTAELSGKAEQIARDKIDDITPSILDQTRSFLWSVVWRAALLITVCWYGYYLFIRVMFWLWCGVKKVTSKLPKIIIEQK